MSDQIAVMNKGRIEQIGEPQAIYDRPATRFVAGFIGNANIVPVTIESVRSGEAMVRIGQILFVIAGVENVRPGKGHMALRYERVMVGAGEPTMPAMPAHLDAEVRGVIFAGSVVQYILVSPGVPLELIAEVSREGGGAMFKQGERVAVQWEANAPRLFGEE